MDGRPRDLRRPAAIKHISAPLGRCSRRIRRKINMRLQSSASSFGESRRGKTKMRRNAEEEEEAEVLRLRCPLVLIVLLSPFVVLPGNSQQLLLAQGVEVQEYCEWESFNATCGLDEVIVIGSARYGRMRLGRCVTKNYGHIGCGADVTSYFDSICSGRHSCVISVIKLHDKILCPTDFKSYLEASYECVKVLTQPEETCNNSTLFLSRIPNGLMASIVAMETGIGAADCPWIIRAEPFQRINVTLFDFAAPPSEAGDSKHDLARAASSGECVEYAVITEGNGPQLFNTSVCGGRRRQGVVFVSSSHTVEIRIVVSSKTPPFLLKYEAFGCSPLLAPPGAWVLISSSQAVVRCNDTEESWRLICRGRRWDGYLGNCSTPLASVQRPDDDWIMDNNFPFGILLVIALGVLIGVAAGVLMLLAVLAYMRRRRLRKIRSRSNYIIDDQMTVSQGSDGKLVTTGSAERRTPIFKPSVGGGSEVFIGRHGTWQRTRPLPVPLIDAERDVSGVGIAMMPVTSSELPLLSPYSLEEPVTPSSGIFGTFGPGYHEQCINLLRRSSSNSRPGAVKGVGMGPGAALSREQGPYYFKLDLTGRHDHPDASGGGGGGTTQCVMCQAGTPREPKQTTNVVGVQASSQRQLDECYQY